MATERKVTKLNELKRAMGIARAFLRIFGIVELDEIARIYLRGLIDIVCCDRAAIILTEPDQDRILAKKDFSKIFGTHEFTLDIPSVNNVLRTKKTFFTEDIENGGIADYIPSERLVNSLICTPILIDGDLRGIIYVESNKKGAFSQEDMQCTMLLSSEISMAFRESFESRQREHMFGWDEITECFDRRRFDVDFASALAMSRTYEEQLSLLVVDIDYFIDYSSTHGRQKSDVLLKKVAEVLSEKYRRANDRLYRYWAQEFAILMVNSDKNAALNVAKRLQKRIEQEPFEGARESQPSGKLTISIGIAAFPSDADNGDKVKEAAELALDIAKAAGGNQVCDSRKDG